MFIFVTYKDAPELSNFRRISSDVDLSVEKILLVNPNCPVRIMLEYIRTKCMLANATQFDLGDEAGGLKGLFELPTYYYATGLFEHKKVYYVIVLKQETDKTITILPQVCRDNRLYADLQVRVKRFLLTGDVSPQGTSGKGTPPPAKGTSKKK